MAKKDNSVKARIARCCNRGRHAEATELALKAGLKPEDVPMIAGYARPYEIAKAGKKSK